MPSAITPLANLTLSASATGITFSSISGLYRDLFIVATYANTVANSDYIGVKINGDTGSNYNAVTMSGSGSSTNSSTYNNSTIGWLTVQGGFEGNLNVNFFDYSATNKFKNWISRNNTSGYGVEAVGGQWNSTSAITSINLYSVNGWSFTSGSTFALYGVSA